MRFCIMCHFQFKKGKLTISCRPTQLFKIRKINQLRKSSKWPNSRPHKKLKNTETVVQLGFLKKLRRAVKGGIDSIFNAEFISEFKKIR